MTPTVVTINENYTKFAYFQLFILFGANLNWEVQSEMEVELNINFIFAWNDNHVEVWEGYVSLLLIISYFVSYDLNYSIYL